MNGEGHIQSINMENLAFISLPPRPPARPPESLCHKKCSSYCKYLHIVKNASAGIRNKGQCQLL